MKIEDSFRIGTILKTRGLKGELQMYTDFEGLEKLKFTSLFIDVAGKLVPYLIQSIKYPMANTAFIYLEDVSTIEKGTLLARKDVYLPNKLKPKKKKEGFTLKDLKGFTAIDEQKGELGEIIEVEDYPQQIIATVHYQHRDIMFPLNTELIKGIDVENGEVYIDLPEGLLDVYLS